MFARLHVCHSYSLCVGKDNSSVHAVFLGTLSIAPAHWLPPSQSGSCQNRQDRGICIPEIGLRFYTMWRFLRKSSHPCFGPASVLHLHSQANVSNIVFSIIYCNFFFCDKSPQPATNASPCPGLCEEAIAVSITTKCFLEQACYS